MNPTGDADRNSLKRTRTGSLDAEADRPPPGQRGVYPLPEAGPSQSVVAPYSGSGGQLHSNAFQSFGNLLDSEGPLLPSIEDLALLSSSSGAWPLQDPLAGLFRDFGPPIPSEPPLAMSRAIYPPPSNIPSYERLMRTAPTTLGPPEIPVSAFSSFSTQTNANQTYILGGTNIENHGNLNIYPQTPSATPDPYVLRLQTHASDNAIHTSAAVDDQGICMPGTRTFTLQRLQSLVASIDSNHPDLIWMHGPAGAGKSAIMRTMANTLDGQGVLLGSFFFFRSDAQRNTSTPFIPTLALQSSTSFQATQPHIRNAIQSHPTIFSQSIRHQLRHLFETPLKLAAADEPKWTAQSPLVLVIDGLDECAGANRQVEIIKAMRQLASTIRSSTNRRVKILIASRPEKPIQDEFERDGSSTTIIELTPSDANIDLFYDTRLDEIRRDKNLPESWPPLRQIKWLKRKTSGQYSFAHISMGFLSGGDPVERLNMLETGVVTHGLEPFEALDALYATIFRQIPPEMADNALLLIRTWMVYRGFASTHFDDLLGSILSFPSGFSSRLLPYLSSIIRVVDGEYWHYHASLGDFLEDPLRSRKYSLFLDFQTLSTAVAEGLLKLCIDPPKLSTNKETTLAWYEYYSSLHGFLRIWKGYFDGPLPCTVTTTMAQLPSLLPTMHLYAFSYCNHFLSIMLEFLSNRKHPLSCESDLSLFYTIVGVLDQVHLIQQLRLAPYEALEVGGDSGLGFFGLLFTFMTHICVFGTNASGTWHCRVAEIVPSLVRQCTHEDIPDTGHDMGEILSLNTLIHQLSAGIPVELYTLCDEVSLESPSTMSDNVIAHALFPIPTTDNFSKLSLYLSRTIEMFLDLPSPNTPIQARISAHISCPGHTMLYVDCATCMSNLEDVRTLVIKSVLHIMGSELYGRNPSSKSWSFDPRTFVRSLPFLSGLDKEGPQGKLHPLLTWALDLGIDFLENVLEQEGQASHRGMDTTLVDELSDWVFSVHELGLHRGDWYPRFCPVCLGTIQRRNNNVASSDDTTDVED